ncbi:MAG: hypothetical protein ABIJ26_05485, partial [Candidatus Margulisiibacteriota bacterium]
MAPRLTAINYDPFLEERVAPEVERRTLGPKLTQVDYDPFAPGVSSVPEPTPVSTQRVGISEQSKQGTSVAGVASALGTGLAEGVTTELPSMVGGAVEFAGSHLPESMSIVEDIGRNIKDWAEQTRTQLYGPEKERAGVERIVYEGAKMLGPSAIPGGVFVAGMRTIKGVGTLVKASKAARAAGDIAKAQKLMAVANKAAKTATSVASASVATLFGGSQAQSTRDTANKRADALEKQGLMDEAQKMRATAEGIAPYATGTIEAVGEFFGTKYLGKLLRLDEADVIKRGAKNAIKDFLKVTGVEVGTEVGQALGQAGVEKVSGIRPEASPISEALDVIGPTVFLTLLTGGAGATGRRITGHKPVDMLGEKPGIDPKLADDLERLLKKSAADEELAQAPIAEDVPPGGPVDLGDAGSAGMPPAGPGGPSPGTLLGQRADIRQRGRIDLGTASSENMPVAEPEQSPGTLLGQRADTRQARIDRAQGEDLRRLRAPTTVGQPIDQEAVDRELSRSRWRQSPEERGREAAEKARTRKLNLRAVGPVEAERILKEAALRNLEIEPDLKADLEKIVSDSKKKPVALGRRAMPEEELVRTGAWEEPGIDVEAIQKAIDDAANEAATSPENELPDPTEEQKKAGNYPKAHLKGDLVNLAGLDITIENPEGSTRTQAKPNNAPAGWKPEWSSEMK